MVADWWSHRVAGDTVAMTAYRRDDVDDLNGRARAYLVRAGEVTGPELILDDRPYQAGDQIVCLRNNRSPRRPQRHPRHHRNRRPRPPDH